MGCLLRCYKTTAIVDRKGGRTRRILSITILLYGAKGGGDRMGELSGGGWKCIMWNKSVHFKDEATSLVPSRYRRCRSRHQRRIVDFWLCCKR